jgi:4-amino-4-deoxy-L-arabinose transferase-like glycosyltransferase
MLAVAVAVLFAYRFWSRPGLGPAIGVGVACGLGALSRSELVLLVPLLAAPLVLLARGRSIGRRLGLASIALLAAVATMAPWVVRNLVTFKQPVYLSTQLGRTLVYSNCNYVYYGPAIGSWQFFCDANLHPQGDESEQAQYLSHVGTTYIGHHLSRLPVVVAARVGRTWSVYDPIGQNRIDTIDGYKLGAIQLRLYSFYVLAAGAVVGVVMLRRHKVPVLPWISVALAVTVGVGVTYGSTRFRAPAEVAIVALAAVGADGMLSLRRSSRAVGSADTKTLGDAGMLPEMSSAGGRWMSSRD